MPEMDRLLQLEVDVTARITGQERAITSIWRAIRLQRPRGVVLTRSDRNWQDRIEQHVGVDLFRKEYGIHYEWLNGMAFGIVIDGTTARVDRLRSWRIVDGGDASITKCGRIARQNRRDTSGYIERIATNDGRRHFIRGQRPNRQFQNSTFVIASEATVQPVLEGDDVDHAPVTTPRLLLQPAMLPWTSPKLPASTCNPTKLQNNPSVNDLVMHARHRPRAHECHSYRNDGFSCRYGPSSPAGDFLIRLWSCMIRLLSFTTPSPPESPWPRDFIANAFQLSTGGRRLDGRWIGPLCP